MMMMENGAARTANKIRHSHSIVMARTKEGTLLRRIDALEYEFVDMEMPIGAYAWQEDFEELVPNKIGKQKVRYWRFVIDQGRYTFRHFDFSLPVPVDSQPNGYEAGETGSSTWFPRIGAYTKMEYKEVMYIVPREHVELDILRSLNDPTILWFFSTNQSNCDSFEYNPEPYIKQYLDFRPSDTTLRVLSQTYALCSHRLDCLTTWNGSVEVEKSKTKKLEIGSWYQCTLNPKIVNKCCSIHPYNADPKPVPTWIQLYHCPINKKESKLCLCRDYVKIPKRKFSRHGEENEFCSEHPLLSKIFFPKYCEFLQGVGVEICFARREYDRSQYENKWQVVAVNTGYGMCWLPELPSSLKDIIRKEEFPFIRSLTSLEAEHYSRFSGNFSFDDVNYARAKWIKEFSTIEFDDSKKIVEKPKNVVDPKCKDKPSHAAELF